MSFNTAYQVMAIGVKGVGGGIGGGGGVGCVAAGSISAFQSVRLDRGVRPAVPGPVMGGDFVVVAGHGAPRPYPLAEHVDALGGHEGAAERMVQLAEARAP